IHNGTPTNDDGCWGIKVPVIAEVNDPAIGPGKHVSRLTDTRIADDRAIFGATFQKIGLIPGDGGAWLLPRIIGHARATQMMLTGEFIDASKAERYGLVSEVVPGETLIARAMELAHMVAQFPPAAIRKTKRLIKDARDVSLAEHLDQAAIWQGVLQQMDDHREAIDAILEKRAPRFTGE
ncbi:MAG: enoyl-CoA hydratase/isomerase family protein, partial [Blastomonas sp.]|nr:enoyl-CoA hydratase/isomerase family protein [Blastomonas sp.]